MEEITFSKSETHNCWLSESHDGKRKTYVRQVQKDPRIITVEMEELMKMNDGFEGWVSVLYEAVNITEIKEAYPDASDKIIRQHFGKIVRQAMTKGGWFE